MKLSSLLNMGSNLNRVSLAHPLSDTLPIYLAVLLGFAVVEEKDGPDLDFLKLTPPVASGGWQNNALLVIPQARFLHFQQSLEVFYLYSQMFKFFF